MPAVERAAIRTELDPPFSIWAPDRHSSPFVFCSPHSGRTYPRHFLMQSKLDALTLRKSEDCYVELLFAPAVACGAPLLAAHFPRAYLDVNREPYELDPSLFADPLPAFANAHSTRVVGGLGTIARIVSDGEEIYPDKLPLDVGLARIEELYVPFHAALAGLIEATRLEFGYAVLIDCHSMPSMTLQPQGRGRPDIVLGDRFGTSCSGLVTGFLREAFQVRGYDVRINRPYAGGFITENYGKPTRGVHALQIEINRGLYLDEASLEPLPRATALQVDIAEVIGEMLLGVPRLLDQRAAAE
ncbi:MAG: N-formylglutamate amidohydrolase [Hyphomicrobiaceae bacterium]|nr:N-formylglutamate amidohydrolase [Hyphomicrobiaceae bacterium]